MTEYTKHLSEPWFSLIKLGIKKCEGRLKDGDFAKFKKDDCIKF
jgi:ASC-1-like (ASCH) protein